MAMPTSKLTIEQLAIADLKKYRKNPREHPVKQVAMLSKSITRYGFNNPILVAPDLEVIAGHGRIEAAKNCGMTVVPGIVLPHLSEAERRAFRIADNNIGLKAVWNLDLLREEVQFVLESEFEFEEIGFETAEVDTLLANDEAVAPETPPEPLRNKPAVSRFDDIWTCGRHRIVCADALMPPSYEALLGTDVAAAVLTDPPWNRKVNGEIGGRGKIRHPEFAMASGEMSRAEFREFMRAAFICQRQFTRDGAICLNFIDWRSVADMVAVGEEIFADGLLNICVWVKQSGGMGSMWRSRHEFICAFKSGKGKHINNVMLGKYGRNRTNAWEYPAPLGWGADRKNLLLHPTSKNVKMLADAIMDITDRGDVVLDPFAGSGATLLAAHQTGRIGRAIEIDPYYVDVCLRRLENATGQHAIDQNGVTFADRTRNP